LHGVTQDNPDTPAIEAGIPLRTMPAAAGVVVPTIGYYISQRDADGDGYENALDPCPFVPDTVWNPRDTTQPIEGDGPDTFPAGPVSDGIPDTCDPTPEATGFQPTDHDDDGFPNRGDNCPLIANKGQEDKDKNADGEEVGDSIGDACDTNPGTPDGAEVLCIRISTVTVGGPGEAAVSPCQTALPAIAGGTVDTSASTTTTATTTTRTGTGTGTQAGGGVGGPVTGIGSLSPVAGTVPAWAAIAGALGTAGIIGSLGTLASRFVKRRRDG
jgi:hypothetical protein